MSFKKKYFALLPIAVTMNLDLMGRINGIPVTWQQITGIFAGFVLLAHICVRKEKIHISSFTKKYLIFLAYICVNFTYVTIFTDYFSGFDFLTPWAWINYLALSIVLPYFVESVKDVEYFLFFIVISFLVINGLGIAQYFFDSSFLPYYIKGFSGKLNHDVRVSSFFYDPNRFSMVLVMVIPLSMFFLSRVGRARITCFLVLVSSVALILASMSRAAYCGLIAILVFYILFFYKVKKTYIVLTSLLLFSALVLYSNPLVLDRFSFFGGGVDLSNMQRIMAWKAGLNAFFDSPFFGVGLGNFYNNYFLFGNYKPNVLENIPLSVLAEAGIVGLLLLGNLFFSACKNMYKKDSLVFKYVLMSVVGFFTFSLFHNYLQQSFFWSLLILGSLDFTGEESVDAKDCCIYKSLPR